MTGVVVLQHLEHEPAGVLTDALAAGGHRADVDGCGGVTPCQVRPRGSPLSSCSAAT